MARLRRQALRSSRGRPWAVIVLVAIAAMGCRSRPGAVNPQSALAPPAAAAPTQQTIQLTDFRQASSGRTGSHEASTNQARAEELPVPLLLNDPGEAAMPPADGPSPETAAPLLLESADSVVTMTLEQAVATALRQNPRLREAAARVGGARASADVAFAPFLPQIGTGFRYSDFSTPVLPGGTFVPASLNAGVKSFVVAEAGVQWTLYDFGRTQGRYGQALDRTGIEALSLLRARQTISFETAQTYFRLLAAQANLRVRNEALQQATSVLRDTDARFVNGDADREDVLRAQVEVAQVQEEVFSAQQAILDAESMLNVELGRSAAQQIEIAPVECDSAFEDSLESCLEVAAATRPEIDMARRAVAEARHGLQAARGELLPKVFIRGAVIRGDSPGPLNGWIEGIGLHVEQSIYSGGAHRGEVRLNQARVSGSMAALQSILDQVTLQVRVSYEAIRTDLARIQLGKITIDQARENLRLTGVKYNNGTATPTDMVDAQTALIQAQTTYITATYSYLTDLAQLQYAMGNDQSWLIKQLKLQETR
jgi:outer membrane protein